MGCLHQILSPDDHRLILTSIRQPTKRCTRHIGRGGPSAAFVLGGVDATGPKLFQIESDGTIQPVSALFLRYTHQRACVVLYIGVCGGLVVDKSTECTRLSFKWEAQVRFSAMGSGFAAAMAILEAQHR